MPTPIITNLHDHIQSLITSSDQTVRILSDDQFATLLDRSYTIDDTTHTIYILQTLTCQDMQTILHTYGLHELPHSIINLHPGVASIIHKQATQEDDIVTMLADGYTVCEPQDIASIEQYIYTDKSYIRIHADDICTLPCLRHATSSICILGTASGSIDLYNVIAGWAAQGKNIDLTPISVYPRVWTDSLTQYNHIIVIMDHRISESIYMYRDQLLSSHLANDARLHFIVPDYNTIQTMLPEYLYEDAGYDAQAMITYIQSLEESD